MEGEDFLVTATPCASWWDGNLSGAFCRVMPADWGSVQQGCVAQGHHNDKWPAT